MADNERLKRTAEDADRVSRATQERTLTEDRTVTDEDRLKMFQSTFFQEALPALPPLPGYHMIWLTTTNPRDSLAMRMRLGYELVRADEYGERWQSLAVKQGSEHAGHIMVNEMIAAKIPLDLYQKFMLEAHHHGPAREQEKLTQVVDQIRADAEQHKARLVEEEGIADLRRSAPTPSFNG